MCEYKHTYKKEKEGIKLYNLLDKDINRLAAALGTEIINLLTVSKISGEALTVLRTFCFTLFSTLLKSFLTLWSESTRREKIEEGGRVSE